MALLVGGLGDHGPDPSAAQVSADRSGRVRLVAAHCVGARSRAPGGPCDAKLPEQRDQRGRVPGLAGRDGDHQGKPVSIDDVVDLRGEPAS